MAQSSPQWQQTLEHLPTVKNIQPQPCPGNQILTKVHSKWLTHFLITFVTGVTDLDLYQAWLLSVVMIDNFFRILKVSLVMLVIINSCKNKTHQFVLWHQQQLHMRV